MVPRHVPKKCLRFCDERRYENNKIQNHRGGLKRNAFKSIISTGGQKVSVERILKEFIYRSLQQPQEANFGPCAQIVR